MAYTLVKQVFTIWATLSSLFCFKFWIGSHIFPGLARVAGMIDVHQDAWLVGWYGDLANFFCLGWPWTLILPISAFWVAGITAMSHCAWCSQVYRCWEFSGVEDPQNLVIYRLCASLSHTKCLVHASCLEVEEHNKVYLVFNLKGGHSSSYFYLG
jgi:hypothetical protein